MKKYRFYIAILVLLYGTYACTEDTDGTPAVNPGNLNVTSVLPDSAAGGELVILKGTGLGDVRSVVFEKGEVQAGFQPTLNTGEVFMFRVPSKQEAGSRTLPLPMETGSRKALASGLWPSLWCMIVSNYNFEAGTEITITGTNLDDVHTVRLTESEDALTIVSQTKSELTVKFPASQVNRSTLDIINETGLLKTTQEFVNLAKAFVIFTEGYGEGFADGSWGDAGTVTDKEAKSGSKSVFKNYQKGNWHLINFANWWPGVAENPEYKFLTVWVKGASQDYTLYLTGDMRAGGFGNGDRSYPLNVPAGKWTYFKIPLSEVKLWEKGSPFFQLGFWIPGPDAQDEIFHFDDIILVK
ncbi:MAG: IPT/TIG domain-containing protein [Leadbetterella sp.]|nr:IPT/TIG domain-containing protein [Leadbetterella sp.]